MKVNITKKELDALNSIIDFCMSLKDDELQEDLKITDNMRDKWMK